MNYRRFIGRLVLVVILIGVLAAGALAGAENKHNERVAGALEAKHGHGHSSAAELAPVGARREVRIGVLAKRGPGRCLAKWGPTADYLTDSIPGYTFSIVPLGFDDIHTTVERGEVDFALVNPPFYVCMELNHSANRIVTLKNRRLGKAWIKFGGVIFYR
ncbi:PhnD/SsuA/transferrin family substrate-binding protein, partial [bacterium]|nr:PhnD/SsuA/transferrin family substrate-binding protein [bacterium]